MSEKEGKGWAEIHRVIEDITGVKLGGNMLPKRYSRLKANFVIFEETDVCCVSTSCVFAYNVIMLICTDSCPSSAEKRHRGQVRGRKVAEDR